MEYAKVDPQGWPATDLVEQAREALHTARGAVDLLGMADQQGPGPDREKLGQRLLVVDKQLNVITDHVHHLVEDLREAYKLLSEAANVGREAWQCIDKAQTLLADIAPVSDSRDAFAQLQTVTRRLDLHLKDVRAYVGRAMHIFHPDWEIRSTAMARVKHIEQELDAQHAEKGALDNQVASPPWICPFALGV